MNTMQDPNYFPKTTRALAKRNAAKTKLEKLQDALYDAQLALDAACQAVDTAQRTEGATITFSPRAPWTLA
jgi:hypothetical protein